MPYYTWIYKCLNVKCGILMKISCQDDFTDKRISSSQFSRLETSSNLLSHRNTTRLSHSLELHPFLKLIWILVSRFTKTRFLQGCIKLPYFELIPCQGLIYLPQNVAVFEHEYGKKFTSQWMIILLNVQFSMFTM